MTSRISLVLGAFAIGLVVVGSLGSQTACSSKTCSTSESQACDQKFSACVNSAASTMDKTACNKCVDDDCSCYTSCGSTCDRNNLNSSCTF